MNDSAINATWERFELTPEGAVWDAAASVLWVADVHLGKAATYRRLGMPVPAGTTASNLLRLEGVLARTSAAHVVILGDLVHSRLGVDRELSAQVEAWRARHARVRLTLIEGNHDRRSGQLPASWRIETVGQPLHVAGVECRHEPPVIRTSAASDTGGQSGFCFAGHVHPAVTLDGPARDRVRLPCFFARNRLLLLPAFGDFTGGANVHEVRLGRPTALFALTGQHVIQVSLPATAG
ncbi:MAG TPA: ligase-associated DNA damage response endonuclease PdeM [Steroidobacteraceae bacterium]|jgi:DNA ligase-associated metallophosphoesterase|nr:ligase-associated DNA damage response endonuclease PdeM [Steroidobacteraceae bacterium]